jgi:hypothetical protein
MSTPSATQKVIIDGDLEVYTRPGSTGVTLGRIAFTDKTVGDIGSIKVFGAPGPAGFRLIHDSAGISRGISFRTSSTQGGLDVGGGGYFYTAEVQNSYIRLGNYTTCHPLQARYPTQDFPGPVLFTSKEQATTGSYAFTNDNIAAFAMRYFLPNQSQTINVGDANGSGLAMGYRGGATIPYGFLGMSSNSLHSITEYIKLISGRTEIANLKSTTIEATNWVGLPPVPPSQLLPITLDNTNGRVGIGQTSPKTSLDVNGTTSTNSLLLQQIPNAVKPDVLMYDPVTKSVSYGPTPHPDISPIKLGTDGIGIGLDPIPGVALNTNVPVFMSDGTETYFYLGSDGCAINGTLLCQYLDVMEDSRFGNVSIMGSDVQLRGIPEQKTGSTLYYNPTTKSVSYGDVSAGDVLPITLDKVNNNVGINNTNPQYDLDVDGVIHSQAIQTNDIVVNAAAPGEGLYVNGEVEFPSLTKTEEPEILVFNHVTGRVAYNDLLPIKLDKTNVRVGINNPAPSHTLDVIGDTQISGSLNAANLLASSTLTVAGHAIADSLFANGTVEAHTVKATEWIGLPATDMSPITLDKPNSRVGIRQAAPNTDLDVNGTTSTRYLMLQSIPNLYQSQVLMYDHLTKAVSYSSLFPITLDKTHNRVGINNATPTTALDVAGAVTASGAIVSGSTTTSTLSLTGIASSTKTNVLMYDTSTKAVSYGPAASASKPTYVRHDLPSNIPVPGGTDTTVMSVSLTPGIYTLTYSTLFTLTEAGYVHLWVEVGGERFGSVLENSLGIGSYIRTTTTLLNITESLAPGGTATVLFRFKAQYTVTILAYNSALNSRTRYVYIKLS